MYGARIPAVYLIPGTNKLRICHYVNHNKNHCHNTGDVGTNWFNLQIDQRKEDEKYMWEIFIDGELEYSIENTGVYFFRKTRAEFANKMPATAQGEFKNFQLSTTRPEREYVQTKEYIYNLIEKFEDVLYNSSDLRRGHMDRFQRNFEFQARTLASRHGLMLDRECLKANDSPYPETWEDDGQPDETETCQAIDQILDRMNKWSEVFLYSCIRANRGLDPMKFHDRTMGHVNSVAGKAKRVLKCWTFYPTFIVTANF